MNRRQKAVLHRDRGQQLNKQWNVKAAQSRYRETGNWYALLDRFPAALFDAHGYVLFASRAEYLQSTYLRIGKQLSVPKGISTMPGYKRMLDESTSPTVDVDIHPDASVEGRRRLVMHLQRERSQTLVRRKKRLAGSLGCEVCDFSFGLAYGNKAADYCEVHHLVPLARAEETTTTRMQDLAILCANCHRVVHLRNPPHTLDEVRSMLRK